MILTTELVRLSSTGKSFITDHTFERVFDMRTLVFLQNGIFKTIATDFTFMFSLVMSLFWINRAVKGSYGQSPGEDSLGE